jgi:hypothetical protein
VIQDTFFNIGQTAVMGGCVLVVVIITSALHHLVKRITRWWNPKWASLGFSILIGGTAQLHFIEVLEPLHIVFMTGNIVIIYLAAMGINAVLGKPVIPITDAEYEEKRGIYEKASMDMEKETWQTRWFD